MDILKNTNKDKLQKITLVAVSALTLLALVLLLVIIMASVDKSMGDNKVDDIVDSLEFESKPITSTQLVTGSLVLADSDHPYSTDASLLDLIDFKTYRNNMLREDGIDPAVTENLPYQPYTGMQLNEEAIVLAHKMLVDAVKAVSQGSITVDGAYGRQENKGNIKATDFSEFDTGLLVFLADKTSDGTASKYVPLSEDYVKWFQKNAAKYGFSKSFENGYRYVGTVHAKYMTDKDLSLSQYIEYLKKNTSHDKPLTVKDSDGTSYGIYYVACKDGDSVNLPVISDGNGENNAVSYEISGTNEGGIIVTVKLN